MATCKLFSLAVVTLMCGAGGCYEGLDEGRGIEPRESGQGWFQVAGQMQLLSYEIVDGYAVFEGDIVLGEIDELTAVELGLREPDRGAVLPGRSWPDNKLVYRLDKNLPERQRSMVVEAIAAIEASTVIRFVQRTNEKDYVTIFKGGDNQCYSTTIGRNGGEQKISLGNGCDELAVTIHEFGHALGLYHEQSRSDRDEHVTVLWDNINKDQHVQFKTFIERDEAGANSGEYDFDSIMHYPSGAFAKSPGLVTITRKDGTLIPYNHVLSAGDIAAIDALHAVGPTACGNGVVDGFEACDYGDGNDGQARYRGGDGDYCGWDPQTVCEPGCGHEMARGSGELGNCDSQDDCVLGRDCWMSSTDGGCACTAVCGNGVVEGGEACDYGEGNRDRAIYYGGDGGACGPDPQAVCAIGCTSELTRDNGGLSDCDAGDDCSAAVDCWMSGDGSCACDF